MITTSQLTLSSPGLAPQQREWKKSRHPRTTMAVVTLTTSTTTIFPIVIASWTNNLVTNMIQVIIINSRMTMLLTTSKSSKFLSMQVILIWAILFLQLTLSKGAVHPLIIIIIRALCLLEISLLTQVKQLQQTCIVLLLQMAQGETLRSNSRTSENCSLTP